MPLYSTPPPWGRRLSCCRGPSVPSRRAPLVSHRLCRRRAGSVAAQRLAAQLARGRPRDLVAPVGNPDATLARQYLDAGGRGLDRRDAARGQPGLADGPVRIPRAALAGLGADAALRHSRLCPGVRLHRPAGFRRAGAEPGARMVRQRHPLPAGALDRWGDRRAGAGLLSLCLPAGTLGLPGPGQGIDGGGTGAGPVAATGVLARRAANGAPGDRCGAGPRPDGNPG